MNWKNLLLLLFASTVITNGSTAQSANTKTDGLVSIVAGKEYKKSKLHQWLWGKNRRKEWSTPVKVPSVLLDTIYGGLTPYEKGGGNESKSLRLKSATGKEYVLRSINKTRRNAIPRILKGSYFAVLIQDGVSMSHPYSAFAIPVMMQHANIYHSRPKLVYIPQQKALDTFNNSFGNNLYLLEERHDGDWSNASHLGNFKNFESTAKVKEKLRDDNSYKADQSSFLKARLFDIFISDVDRHDDNWRWGIAEGSTVYKPIPRDRDQAFFTHDGLLSGIALAVTRRRFMQSFEYRIKNVKRLTLTSRNRKFDYYFTNEMEYDDWMKAAGYLQQTLTDSIIAESIQQLPPEVFAISGKEMVEKLILRRNDLHHYASLYYYVLSKKVEINGSTKKEHFEVKKLAGKKTAVNVYRVNTSGIKETEPYYSRVFNEETEQITLYGFGGNDIFDIDKNLRGVKVIVEKGINKVQFPPENNSSKK